MAIDKEEVEALTSRLPDGYIIAQVVEYAQTMKSKSGLDYTISMQLLNKDIMDIPRGVGNTLEEAFNDALTNVGGDDGLSKFVRDLMQGTKH